MDSCTDTQEYIQSQYSNSPTIKEILSSFYNNINPCTDIQTLYDNILNIDTAKGIGLDYWGRIIGIKREIFIDDTTAPYPLLGFNGSELNPFNQGVFVTLDDLETGNRVIATLGDDLYRRLLMFKALANISGADMATLNNFSTELFNTEDIIVTNIQTEGTLDNGDKYNASPMQVRWIWRTNSITNVDKSLFTQFIVLSLAAGVGYSFNVISKDPLFGFSGSGLNPFNQGAFGTIYNVEEER